MTMKHPVIGIFGIYLLLAGNPSPLSAGVTTISYDSSGTIIPNPERGFSVHKSSKMTLSYLAALREDVTVVQRLYTMPQFNDGPIEQYYLDIMQEDFDTAREGGVKLVLRFSYTDNQSGADAPLDTILMHLDQLQPLLAANADVIAYLEAGFIGAWGEWYYSSNNLNNTTSYRAVLQKIEEVLPTRRMVVVRTPKYKRAIFDYLDPLTTEEAFTGIDRARTGAHNDCFLAARDDYGTYVSNDIEGDKDYLNLDNRYVPQGGETCNDDATYTNCANALADLERMRWSVLNKDYHPSVLSRWVTGGCMDEVKRRLGYRFRLLEAVIADSVRPGGALSMSFQVINDGWASTFNPRNVDLILRRADLEKCYYLRTDADPGFWLGGDTATVTITGGIPDTMATGEWEILLHLSDPEPELRHRPEYAIQLANVGLWEPNSGYNTFNHSVSISASAGGDVYTGDNYFQPDSSCVQDTSLAIRPERITRPTAFRLLGNYPNPFNAKTTIRVELIRPGETRITFYDLKGRRVDRILSGPLPAGTHSIPWKPRGLGSGIYLYQLDVDAVYRIGKAVYLK